MWPGSSRPARLWDYRPSGLGDGEVHQGLVEEQVGDLAEGHGPGVAAGVLAFETAVEVVENAVAGETRAPSLLRANGGQFPGRRGKAVLHPGENRRIEVHQPAGRIDSLEGDVDDRPAIVRHQRQVEVRPDALQVIRQASGMSIDLAFVR